MTNNLPALLPGIKPPTMPTFDMFAKTGILRVRHDWDTGKVDWRITVHPHRMIPREHCGGILAELEAASVPAPKPVAARLAKFLLGAYPARDLTDPTIFVGIITHTFGTYPPEIGLQAVDNLTRQSKWLPTRADITEACEALMLERRYAAEVVKAHLEKHDELDRAREAERKRMEDRQKRYAAEPWLMIRDTYRDSFGCGDAPDWEPWLEGACQEFGARTVEQWHDEAEHADRRPAHWYALREFLNARATRARQASQAQP